MKEHKIKNTKTKFVAEHSVLHNKSNTQSGITLVALIITIVVLLILAIVSIRLVMNGGLIDKAKSAVDKYSEEEVGEQIKLAYLECQQEKIYNSNIDEEDFLTKSLKQTLSDENLSVKLKNGKVTVNTTVKGEPKTYIFKSSTGESYEYKDPFDYGGKTKNDLVPGDDITLGTEKFRVFYNQDGVIKAMCFFNLKLDSNPMRQATAEEATNGQEGRAKFSKRPYWSRDEAGNEIEGWNSNAVNNELDIDMNNPDNNIQDYINAYEKKIDNLGAERIEIRIARRRELNISGITRNIKNPGQLGR